MIGPNTTRCRRAGAFVALAGLVFLAHCAKEGVETFGFAEEIAGHFGEMHYGAFAVDGAAPRGADVLFVKGDGQLQREDEPSRYYKWAFLTADGGLLIGGYVGDDQKQATSSVNLTKDETRDAMRRCSATHPDVEDMFDCFDRVLAQVVNDCEFSLSVEDCQRHCWYDLGKCRGG